jgi:arginyl-tRNA--protein-N-Asp/Glu arginylyltransferase
MTRQDPAVLSDGALPVPLLPGRMERKVFTHLVGDRAAALNDVLTQGGFRRSQNIAYRPACEGCRSCISVRTVVDAFEWTSSFKRTGEGAQRDLVGAELTDGARRQSSTRCSAAISTPATRAAAWPTCRCSTTP